MIRSVFLKRFFLSSYRLFNQLARIGVVGRRERMMEFYIRQLTVSGDGPTRKPVDNEDPFSRKGLRYRAKPSARFRRRRAAMPT